MTLPRSKDDGREDDAPHPDAADATPVDGRPSDLAPTDDAPTRGDGSVNTLDAAGIGSGVSAADRVQTSGRAPETSGTSSGYSAADRVQSRQSASASRQSRSGWLRLALLGLVGAAIAVGVVALRGAADPDTDLLSRLDASADAFRAELVTVDATAAERYILDAFGWPVEAPDLPGLQLIGVGEASVLSTPALDVSMPAFRYDARSGETLVVFVYDYVLLDGTQGALELPEAVYSRLAETPAVDVRRQDGLSFVSWRVRSVVYTAVTDDEEIAEQIARGVSD